MGKQLKPIYVCDECQIIFEDPNDVIVFTTIPQNGEDKPLWDNVDVPVMFCQKCLTSKLQLRNIQSDTKENLRQMLIQFDPKIHDLNELLEEEKIDEEESQETSLVEDIEESQQDEMITLPEDADIPIDNDDGNQIQFTESVEKYQLLYKIQNVEQEEWLAYKFGFVSIDKFYDACGGSVIGLYVPVKKYSNSLPKRLVRKKEKILTRIVAGFPYFETLEIYVDEREDCFALVESCQIKTNDNIMISVGRKFIENKDDNEE